jgi:predicted aspartyl protease
MPFRRWSACILLLILLAGCTLYSDVSISPLITNPQLIDRGSDVQSMIRKADYLRAIEFTEAIETRSRRSAHDLSALGSAELAAGRYDAARRHLRAALDLSPVRDTLTNVEWSLSQLEYLSNNFEASRDWAEAANSHGLTVRKWHLDYLAALSTMNVYRFSGLPSSQIAMKYTRPDVPRIDVRMNGRKTVNAVIDSGAVLSIASERLASELPIRTLGNFEGTFYGLLGEPIAVRFGMLDSLTLGDIVVENVPVAIMPDSKMRFLMNGRREFKMDFLIGANFLKEFRTDLDFPRGVVTFTRLTSRDRVPAADQNLFTQGFRPIVRGTINRRGWFVFVLDTGSEITFLNETQVRNLPIDQIAPRIHSALLQGLGGSQKRGAKVDNLEIGIDRWAGTFKSLPMYASDEHENAAGIIGENFLKKFRVVIDFGRMRVDLIRGSEATLATPPSPLTAKR